jgi:hypothetical protein
MRQGWGGGRSGSSRRKEYLLRRASWRGATDTKYRAIDLHCGPTLIDFFEIAVAAAAVLEARGAGDAIFRQCFTPVDHS